MGNKDVNQFVFYDQVDGLEPLWQGLQPVQAFPKKTLKVHKNENFFGSDLEFCTTSLLVMLKY